MLGTGERVAAEGVAGVEEGAVGEAAAVLAEDQLRGAPQVPVGLFEKDVADRRQEPLAEDERLGAPADEQAQAGQAERLHVGDRVEDRVQLVAGELVEAVAGGLPLVEPTLTELADVGAVLGLEELDGDVRVTTEELVDIVALGLVGGTAELDEIGGVVEEVGRVADDRVGAVVRAAAAECLGEGFVDAADLPADAALIVALHQCDAAIKGRGGLLGRAERRQGHREDAAREREEAQTVGDDGVEEPLAGLPGDVVGEAVVGQRDAGGVEVAAKERHRRERERYEGVPRTFERVRGFTRRRFADRW